MKIEIDTKHDSKEEIKKVIKMLNHLVEESAVFGSYASSYGDSSLGSSNSQTQATQSSYDSMPGLGFMDNQIVSSEEKDEEEEKKVGFSSLETF